MIKNERQYWITKIQADRFAKALGELDSETAEGLAMHPLLFKAKKDAAKSQLADLEEELQDYERLKSGDFELVTGLCERGADVVDQGPDRAGA